MGAYPSTALQVLAPGSPLDSQFLQIETGLDRLVTITPGQGDATNFAVYNNDTLTKPFYPTYFGLDANGPEGSTFAFTDLLSRNQPILFAERDRFTKEGKFVQEVRCGAYPPKDDSNGPNNRLKCQIGEKAPVVFLGGWAICDTLDGYGRRDLWLYDEDFFNNEAPVSCTAVELLIIQAPSH